VGRVPKPDMILPPEMMEARGQVERFASRRSILNFQDCSSNDSRRDRRVIRLEDQFVAVLYAPEARDCYTREHAFLGMDIDRTRLPQLVEAEFDPNAGGYLVMTAVAGQPLAEIQNRLTVSAYTEIIADLGACLAAIHVVAPRVALRMPATYMEETRARHFDEFPEVIDRLGAAGVFAKEVGPALMAAVQEGSARAFRTPQRVLHADVHNGNVLVTQAGGRWSCVLVDFEKAGLGHVELEFIVLFQSILSEAFPGRPYTRAWREIWHSFTGAYASKAGIEPDLGLIIAHAIARCLWVSLICLERGDPRHRDFVKNALEMLDVVHQWGPDRP
jgi:Phosphotransferase enzyme family